jgi:hypothetical protein
MTETWAELNCITLWLTLWTLGILSGKPETTTGKMFANWALLADGVEAMSLISVSLALLSTSDSASGSKGFKLGSRGTVDDIEGPQLTR